MMQIIFKDGSISELNNIEKIYMEEHDHEKITIVGKLAPISFLDDELKEAMETINFGLGSGEPCEEVSNE